MTTERDYGMRTITVQVPAPLKTMLKKMSQELGLSIGEIIIQYLRFLKAQKVGMRIPLNERSNSDFALITRKSRSVSKRTGIAQVNRNGGGLPFRPDQLPNVFVESADRQATEVARDPRTGRYQIFDAMQEEGYAVSDSSEEVELDQEILRIFDQTGAN